MYFPSYAPPAAGLLAIEPVADTFDRLRSNVEANALCEEVLLMKRAVQKAPGRVRMGQVRGASGGSFVWREGSCDLPPNASAEYEEVEADGLLAIIEAAGLRADAVALVWADVQGCESAVIETSAPLWDGGVPLWAEVEPRSLQRQGALASFAALAANHFDRFIPSRELVRCGPHATARPIGELPALIRDRRAGEHRCALSAAAFPRRGPPRNVARDIDDSQQVWLIVRGSVSAGRVAGSLVGHGRQVTVVWYGTHVPVTYLPSSQSLRSVV